jgi:hypothetical protein
MTVATDWVRAAEAPALTHLPDTVPA